MDEMKALNRLSIMQMAYKTGGYNETHEVLQLAMDDIALVMNILAIYNDDEIHALYILDDIIKTFIDQRRANNENSKH